MPSIGPELPPHLQHRTRDVEDTEDDDNDVAGPSIGPAIPADLPRRSQHRLDDGEDADEDEGFGPQLPADLRRSHSKRSDEDAEDLGASIGPSVPARLRKPGAESSSGPSIRPSRPPDVAGHSSAPPDDGDEDDYMPALPPDLRPSQPAKRIIGPSFPTGPPPPRPDDDSDDEVGPMPPAPWEMRREEDGVAEFLERERRQAEKAAEAAKPKKLQRDEWMLLPPTSGSLLSNIDPTKLKSKRVFNNSAAPRANKEGMELWTETPQEKLERLQAEVTGKRKRAVDAGADEGDAEEARIKRRRDEEIQRRVEEHNKRSARTSSLVEMHASKSKGEKKDPKDDVIWDHERDMSLGGRLMDEGKRKDLIKDAKGLGGRFERGRTGGYL